MIRGLFYIFACWLENTAHAIMDRIGMSDDLPPVMMSGKCIKDIHRKWEHLSLTADEWADIYAGEKFHD